MMKSLQIDFLAVNSGEKSGDAIAFRYGDFSYRNGYKVVVIDGGTLEAGRDLVAHLKDHFNTDRVDLVVCTHPDADHASGLREVMNNCTVGELWIHKPWEHSEHIRHLFHDGRITDNSLSERLKEAYNYAHELVEIAEANDVDVREPFAGRSFDNNSIQVLGPDVDYYRELVCNFARSPELKESTTRSMTQLAASALQWLQETLNIETLDESGETSSENSSSAVLLLNFEGDKFLFTGDAGIASLKKVIEYSEANGIDISKVTFMQAPHHGSKRNLSPSVLDAIKCDTAYISASKESKKHPSRKVMNAFKRRGAQVFSTEGNGLCHQRNCNRGWGSASPHPFYYEVEA